MFIIRRQRQFRRQPVWSASSAVCSGAGGSSGPHECLFLVNLSARKLAHVASFVHKRYLELMVWMKLSRPCVRIKRPDLCCAPRSTCPRVEECRIAGLGKQHRRTTQATMYSACPSLLSAQKSVTPTAAQPRVQSLKTGTYLLDGFAFRSLCPRASRSFLLVPMGSASMHLLHRLLRRPRGIGLSVPP